MAIVQKLCIIAQKLELYTQNLEFSSATHKKIQYVVITVKTCFLVSFAANLYLEANLFGYTSKYIIFLNFC